MEEQPRRIKRQTAYKVWISHLINNNGTVDDTGLAYIPVGDKKVVRANIVGSVIGKELREGFGSLVLDDGSENVNARVWGEDTSLLNDIEIGDLVLVIARLGEFNGNVYLRPEVVKKIDMDWALLRRLELVKEYGKPEPREIKVEEDKVEEKEERIEEPIPSIAIREKVLKLVEEREEVAMETVIEKVGEDERKIKAAVDELLKEGEMFMPRPGYLRVV
jgi:RPA family protein